LYSITNSLDIISILTELLNLVHALQLIYRLDTYTLNQDGDFRYGARNQDTLIHSSRRSFTRDSSAWWRL